MRNRWRLRLALRGAVVVVAGTILALLLSASGLESFRFSTGAIIAFRILSGRRLRRPALLRSGVAAAASRHRRAGRDILQECDPTLEAAIISAVEAHCQWPFTRHSPRLVEKARRAGNLAVPRGRARQRRRSRGARNHAVRFRSRRSPAITALIDRRSDPAYLRRGLSALLIISRSAEGLQPVQHRGRRRANPRCRAAPTRRSARSCSASARTTRRC